MLEKQGILTCDEKDAIVDGLKGILDDIEQGKLAIDEYKKISPVFEEDIYKAISMETCVERRNTIGAPGQTAIKAVIAMNDEYLAET